MIGKIDFEKLLKRALFYGGDYADIFVENRESTFVQMEDGRIIAQQ